MFGYIKPFKPEMKIKEFDTFKAVYCGLCRQLSHVYGPFASLTLSYDFTFVAVLALGLEEKCEGFKKCRCVANPLKKKMCLVACDDLDFCASCAMLMIYYKLKDDIADSSFFKKIGYLCVLPFASHAGKKAAKKYPQIDNIISEAISKQSEIEKSDNASLDRAADPTAAALGEIFKYLAKTPTEERILQRFGYLVGRYVYFADALDDIDDDIKNKGYNPFVKRYEKESLTLDEIKKRAVGTLNLTVGEIPPAYELLELKRYKEILDNIIYLGFHNEMNFIMNRKGKKEKNEQSI